MQPTFEAAEVDEALAALRAYATERGGARLPTDVSLFYENADGQRYRGALKTYGLKRALSRVGSGLRYDGSGATAGEHRIRLDSRPDADRPPTPSSQQQELEKALGLPAAVRDQMPPWLGDAMHAYDGV